MRFVSPLAPALVAVFATAALAGCGTTAENTTSSTAAVASVGDPTSCLVAMDSSVEVKQTVDDPATWAGTYPLPDGDSFVVEVSRYSSAQEAADFVAPATAVYRGHGGRWAVLGPAKGAESTLDSVSKEIANLTVIGVTHCLIEVK